MYNLPQATHINQPLYKKAVFEKFNLKTADRDRFDADISKMVLVAHVASNTVPALKPGNEVKDFYVLQVILKRRDYDENNILLLHRLIPQNIVFALQYEEQAQLAVFHTSLLQSAWMPITDTAIQLQGLTIADAWKHIVADIGNLDATAETSIEEQIADREHREKLLRQIESLEKRCRAEKQTRKKYELHQQILKLKTLIR